MDHVAFPIQPSVPWGYADGGLHRHLGLLDSFEELLQPLYDWLEEASHDVRLDHLKDRKTDKLDSETLAHLLRTDLLPESYVPPREMRELRDQVSFRVFLIEIRTRIKNRIHAELAKRG